MKRNKLTSIVSITILGFALAVLLLTACETENSNESIAPETVATPTAMPPAGTYSTAQTVTLSTATAGASIHYTLDDSTPTTDSRLYSSPIAIGATTTLRAIAVKDGMNASAVLTATYTITSITLPQTAATPIATPGSGQVADNTAITLATATEGAVIYFTQDGTEPNTTSVPYSDSNKPVITTGKLTLKAISDKAGMNTSTVLTATYTLVPVNTPPTANAGNDQTVTLASDLTVTLNGASSTDPDGSIVSFAWECVGYDKHEGVQTPYTLAQVTSLINNGNTATASVDLRKAGVYTFRLTVKDNDGASATRDVRVTVEPDTRTEEVTLDYPPFVSAATTLNLHPVNLPAEVTYTITSDNPVKTFTLGEGGFNGTINVSDGPYANSTTHVFTQTFKVRNDVVGSQIIRARVLALGVFQY